MRLTTVPLQILRLINVTAAAGLRMFSVVFSPKKSRFPPWPCRLAVRWLERFPSGSLRRGKGKGSPKALKFGVWCSACTAWGSEWTKRRKAARPKENTLGFLPRVTIKTEKCKLIYHKAFTSPARPIFHAGCDSQTSFVPYYQIHNTLSSVFQ